MLLGNAATCFSAQSVLKQWVAIYWVLQFVGALHVCHANAFVADVDAGPFRVPAPIQYFPFAHRAHHCSEALSACDQDNLLVTLRDFLSGVIDQILRGVATGWAIARVGWVCAKLGCQGLRNVAITTEWQAGGIGAVGDEADGRDGVNFVPQLSAKTCVFCGQFCGFCHQRERRLGNMNVFFFLDQLAATHQNWCAWIYHRLNSRVLFVFLTNRWSICIPPGLSSAGIDLKRLHQFYVGAWSGFKQT